MQTKSKWRPKVKIKGTGTIKILRRLYDEQRREQVEKQTTYIAHFTDYIGKHLSDDVKAKISN